MQTSLKSMRNIVLTLSFLLASACAYAQPMFRSVMPDGKIVYGDKPAPGAKESKQVNLAPLNIATPSQPTANNNEPAAGAAGDPNAAAEIAGARQTLEAAKATLEEGRVEREGDRTGTVGGKARLSESYVERVTALESAVADAQKQLDALLRNGGR
ncbi:MAG: hypothetical protein JWN94_2272 [Betaproteobacteria bacterium]|nr:hypothetical protein [Betaproteobacteria bacterium]